MLLLSQMHLQLASSCPVKVVDDGKAGVGTGVITNGSDTDKISTAGLAFRIVKWRSAGPAVEGRAWVGLFIAPTALECIQQTSNLTCTTHTSVIA